MQVRSASASDAATRATTGSVYLKTSVRVQDLTALPGFVRALAGSTAVPGPPTPASTTSSSTRTAKVSSSLPPFTRKNKGPSALPRPPYERRQSQADVAGRADEAPRRTCRALRWRPGRAHCAVLSMLIEPW
jgi:hypothetical protein